MNAPLRVLIPSDGSDPSRRAVAHVLSLAARGLLVDVHVLNVQSAVRGSAAALVSPRDLEGYHRDEGMLGFGGLRVEQVQVLLVERRTSVDETTIARQHQGEGFVGRVGGTRRRHARDHERRRVIAS